MAKFNIGDKVKCIDGHFSKGGPKKNEIYTITSIVSDYIGFPLSTLDSTYRENVKNGSLPNWGQDCFELVLEAPKNKPPTKLLKTGWGF